ncbi:MAG: glucans biosynthesis glucosyltransferase MdoH, partial [Shewanella sp.]
GIMAYLSSPFWLMLILTGLMLALQAHFIRPEYFTDQFSLFPTWPIMDSDRALRLFYITMGVLFGPKVFGVFLLLKDGEFARSVGGRIKAICSVIFEVILSALIAPIMMFIHCGAVMSILMGRDSGWSPQRRDDGSMPWMTLIYRHRWHMLAGVMLGYAAILDSLTLLAWMSPALIGLWIAVPISAWTGSIKIGEVFKRAGILATPEERNPAQICLQAQEARAAYQRHIAEPWTLVQVLKDPALMELHLAMVDKQPLRAAGTPIEAMEAIVHVKVHEARCHQSALALLNRQEMAMVLANPLMLRSLQKLPEQFVEEDLVSFC